jgi:hypothetical protein
VTGAPSATQIAELMAWARRLSDAHCTGDPADRAAYQAAKADLLARIAATNPHHTLED